MTHIPHPDHCPCQRCESWRAEPFARTPRPDCSSLCAPAEPCSLSERGRCDALRAALCARLEELGDDEVRVLAYIANRLYMGAGQYGPLDIATDPRNWCEEARQEFADGAVYMAIAGLRATSRGAK